MLVRIDWRKVLELMHDVVVEDGFMTITFDKEIDQISDRLDLLCNCCGIAFMSSPTEDKNHYSIAGLMKSRDGNKVIIAMPIIIPVERFIGVRVYHVDEYTLSRRFYFNKDRA